jgi:nucleotide-binding universal stress UspA family protein
MTDPIIIGYDPRSTAAGDVRPGAQARDAQGSGGQDRLLRRRVHEDLLPACSRAIELRSAVAELGDDVDVQTDAVVGDPAEVLVDLSQQIDLLVCGSRGDGPVRGVCWAACRAGS